MISIPLEMSARAARWGELKRWERRELAVELRALGLSLKEIAAIVPASRGSLSVWCRDVELTEEQRARLAAKRPALAVRRELGARRRRAHLERIESIRAAAREEARGFLLDPNWIAGVVAYWSEGAKRTKELRFSNSDPALVQLFIRWARTYLNVTKFSAKLHLHDGQEERERIEFWSIATGIPAERFGKTYIKPEGTGHRKNRLYNGTITIRPVTSSDQLHRVMGWIDVVAAAQQNAARESAVIYNPRARAASSIGRASAS